MRFSALARRSIGLLYVCLLCFFTPFAHAFAPETDACAVQIVSIMATKGEKQVYTRPDHGWAPVILPDNWTRRWPEHQDPVWYRIDWKRHCSSTHPDAAPLALMLDGINMNGEIHLNDTLIWRGLDPAGTEALGWNMPLWWLLPDSALRDDINQLWIRVEGANVMMLGLGSATFGPVDTIQQAYNDRLWRQRTVYYISLGLSAALGMIFFVVWYLHPAERAFGWYALVSLLWVLYLFTILGTSTWPFSSIGNHVRLNIFLFVLYVTCFCMFTWRFGDQHFPRTERLLWLTAAVGALCALFAPQAFIGFAWIAFMLIFCANCLQFQWHAWRTRKPEHLLLALCWLIFLLIAVHDMYIILQGWKPHETWGFISGPVSGIFMSLLLGGRLAFGIRHIQHFNVELQQRVDEARSDLAQALTREHEQALAHAKLQERMHIVHDLHDGLGSSLVRGMALVEKTPHPLDKTRTLSLLKTLRDDLRQLIDHGSSATAIVPDTPVQWLAPLRHRFTHLFDEMDIRAQWEVDRDWQVKPSALQCLGMTRVVEEALSNIIKHSRAKSVDVSCNQTEDGTLTLAIKDNGIGFDLEAVRNAGQSVGMRSMAARAERLGGKIQVSSSTAGTYVALTLQTTDKSVTT